MAGEEKEGGALERRHAAAGGARAEGAAADSAGGPAKLRAEEDEAAMTPTQAFHLQQLPRDIVLEGFATATMTVYVFRVGKIVFGRRGDEFIRSPPTPPPAWLGASSNVLGQGPH